MLEVIALLMTSERIDPQSLLFLLAAAPSALGCESTTPDDTDTPTITTATETGNDTEGATSLATDGTGHGTTQGSSDPTQGSSDTTASPADTTEGTTGTTGGTCEDYAALFDECYGAKDPMAGALALQACNDYLDYFGNIGDDCLAVFEDYMACLSALSCRDFMQEVGCEREENAFGLACLVR